MFIILRDTLVQCWAYWPASTNVSICYFAVLKISRHFVFSLHLWWSIGCLHTHITEGEPKCMWSTFYMKHPNHNVCCWHLGNIWTALSPQKLLRLMDIDVDLLISINILHKKEPFEYTFFILNDLVCLL